MRTNGFWALDKGVIFLNHGSFGACPRAVLEEQTRIRAHIESNPTKFFLFEHFEKLAEVRRALGAYLGADPEDLVLTPNATYGVNAVLASQRIGPGEQILVTNHAYGACNNAAAYFAAKCGAVLRTARVPFPLRSPREIVNSILSAVTPKTRLAVLDHVTSSTALIFPVQELVKELEARGVPVLIDGAHAPGMLDLNLKHLGASYYVGTCHKWLCAPKGAAFLYVRSDLKDQVVSPVVGHGLTWPEERATRFHNLFDWPGTFDPSALLAVPTALEILQASVPGGWPALRIKNARLARRALALICEELDLQEPAPAELTGSMATVILPLKADTMPKQHWLVPALQQELSERYKIEVAVPPWEGEQVLLRLSAQLYNELEDYRRLAQALKEILARY